MSVNGVQQPTIIYLPPNSPDGDLASRQESAAPPRSRNSRSVTLQRVAAPDYDEDQARAAMAFTAGKRSRDESNAALMALIFGTGAVATTLGFVALATKRSRVEANRIGDAGASGSVDSAQRNLGPSLLDMHGNLPGHNPLDFTSVSFQQNQVHPNDCPLNALEAFLHGVGNRTARERRFDERLHDLRGSGYSVDDRSLELAELHDFANAELRELHGDQTLSPNIKRQLPTALRMHRLADISSDWRANSPEEAGEVHADVARQYREAFNAESDAALPPAPHRLIMTRLHAVPDNSLNNGSINRGHYIALAWHASGAQNHDGAPLGSWRLVDGNGFANIARGDRDAFDLNRLQPIFGHQDVERTHDSLTRAIAHYASAHAPRTAGRSATMNMIIADHSPVANHAAPHFR